MVGPSINSRGLPSAERCAWAEAVVTFREAIALNLGERPPRDRINLANGILNITTGDPQAHSLDVVSKAAPVSPWQQPSL